MIAGCQTGKFLTPRHHEFAMVDSSVAEAVGRAPCLAAAIPTAGGTFAGEHSLDEYITFALSQHPKIQAAKWEVDAAAWQVPVAASLEDPKLSLSALPAPIETAAGQQNVQVGISQKLPIREKQERKEGIARAATEQAKAKMAAEQREVAADVRVAYAELLYRQEALGILDDERALLSEVTEIIVALYKTNKVSQQDIAQAELAELQIEQQLISARLALTNSQTRMARLIRVAPDSDLRAQQVDCLERLSVDAQTVMHQAIATRPELHALIQQANQQRMAANLAKLDYVPDPTLGATWIGIANAGISPVTSGDDALLLNVSMNLPIYHKRIEGKIKSAEAKAVSAARRYDDLRDETLRVVYDSYSQLESKLQLIELLRDEIIPKADETLKVSVKAYSVSEVDIQQVLGSWQKLIRLELSMRELERGYRQSLAELERVVGVDLPTFVDCKLTRLPPPVEEVTYTTRQAVAAPAASEVQPSSYHQPATKKIYYPPRKRQSQPYGVGQHGHWW